MPSAILRDTQNGDAMHLSETVKIVIVGHVDHGKSTLIGRLFYDTGSIPEVRMREIEETCSKQGRPFEFAYLMDALEEERDHNVTIDTCQTFFETEKRPYVIIDAPGHVEFLKNMITGAASADAAILLLDGIEGVRKQTRRHAYLLSMLGIRQVIVAVNKLDIAGYDRHVFQEAENEIRNFLNSLGVIPSEVIPISARDGENVADRLGNTPWYKGPTIIEALDTFSLIHEESKLPLRFPIQDVYKSEGKRIYVGRVETGSLQTGDSVVFTPSGRRTRVKSIEVWDSPEQKTAETGECIGLIFTDEIFVERGEVMSHTDSPPPSCHGLKASVFWLANHPFQRGETYRLKLATAEVEATCVDIEERLDSSTLNVTERHADFLETTETGTVAFSLKNPIPADPYSENAPLGRFVIEAADGFIGGGGIVREVTGELGLATKHLIHLNRKITTEPDGNLVDLTREPGALEFTVTPYFLDTLAAGNRILFKLRGPKQIEHVARLAYQHHLNFTFSRDGDAIRLTLFQEGAERPIEKLEGLGL